MKNTRYSFFQRSVSLVMTVVLMLGLLPNIAVKVFGDDAYPSGVVTVADPETLTRPTEIYGDNTKNAGKITVGKSVEAADEDGNVSVTVNGKTITADDPENFLVTITQTAQVMGLASESPLPLDVVFVLDTSGSMGTVIDNSTNDRRVDVLRQTVNSAIKTLMEINENNRVGVVAFSAYNTQAGSAGNDAANVLSELAHYEGEAASEHLTWGTGTCSWAGGIVQTIQGRSLTNGSYNSRFSTGGATNIQAGIATGAQLLMNADTTAVVNGEEVTRMPFLIVVSDGAPVCSSSNNDWQQPSMTMSQGTNYHLYAGNSFLPMLTAAYYKQQISQRYYPDGDGALTVYTMGYSVQESEQELSAMTLNPLDELNNTDNDWYEQINSYWTGYKAQQQFSIQVGRPGEMGYNDNNRGNWYYTFYPESTEVHVDNVNDIADNTTIISAENFYADQLSRNDRYVTFGDNIDETVESLAYNDDYYSASSVEELQKAFGEILQNIQIKAVTAPTKVTGSADFSGYVHFYDPIGEYMEVKDLKGILADGNHYQGAKFAELLASGEDDKFNATLKRVLTERLALSESNIDVDDFMADASVNANGTNSFCWWGVEYDSGEEDIHMQVLGSVEDDSIAYIEDENNGAPADATHVCRSYFFYGTAGGTLSNPNHEYMYFVIRVQRSLEAPYQQTVCISVPASLLSVEKVVITEDINGNYTASVEKNEPLRVIYEVGLRSDINAQNVADIVDSEYASEAPADGNGSVNYDAETDTYHFFTNDWDRSESLDSHHRAMTKATFDAASDNSYYTYQEDTLLLVKNGDRYEAYNEDALVAGTYYYARTYFDWTDKSADAAGNYPAEIKVAYIEVSVIDVTDNAFAQDADGNWYIKKGVYTSITLNTHGDDTEKSENVTGTSSVVSHPHRTGEITNSHYTVMLGNNGRLALTYDPVKSVSGERDENGTKVQLTDGSVVVIGDKLTYTVKVVNNEDVAVDAVVTDIVPAGTKLVSISNNGVIDSKTNVITWELEDVPAHSATTVSFVVEVTEAVLDESFVSVDNIATITIGNNPSYNTNKTTNPPVGKLVEGATEGLVPENGVQVGDELIYRVRYTNNTDSAATVTVTDKIPAGTEYLEGSASHNGTYSNGELTWVIENVEPNRSGYVSFRVVVNASAKTTVVNEAYVQIGTNGPSYKTNPTTTHVKVGSLKLSKTVTVPQGYTAVADRQNTVFTLQLNEIGNDLNGVYVVEGADYGYVLFENGKAYMSDESGKKLSETEGISIKHGQTVLIKDLTAGANLSVKEVTADGYTPSYSGDLETDGTITIPATHLDAATVEISALNITNAYRVVPAPFQLSGVKKVNGILPDGDIVFTFTSQACDANGNVLDGAVTVVATATVNQQNKEVEFSFSPRSFSNEGDYYYLITEVQSNINGVVYDTTEYLLTINVKDDGKGVLTATHSLKSRSNAEESFAAIDDKSVTFNNSYVPKDTQIVLEGKKELSNLNMGDSEFSFIVKDSIGKEVATGQNKADGTIEFKPITYTASDLGKTYTYYVSEVDGRLAGIKYDDTVFTVTVKITDEGGQLKADVSYPANGIVFKNSFTPDSAKVQLEAEKILTGESTTLKAGEFSFEVTDASGNVVSNGTNEIDGSVIFGEIGFTLPMLEGAVEKTFVYTISEVIPDLSKEPFVEYSKETYTVEITVTYDSSEGKLTASEPVYKKGNNVISTTVPQFTNHVNKNYVELIPEALTKSTTGNPPAGTVFGFSVINSATGTTVGTGIGDANGDVVFNSLRFDAAGIYNYWVQETNAGQNIHGIKYDDTRYLLKIVVEYDEENSELKVTESKYYALKNNGDKDNVADYTETPSGTHFQNEYKASGSVTVSAEKVMEGRTLRAGEFNFLLEGNGVQVNGSMDEKGNITFAPLYYDQDDLTSASVVLTYTMSEIIPVGENKLAGVTYDTTKYIVKVTLTDKGNGVIETSVAYEDEEGESVKTVFTNKYHPVEDTSAIITVNKEITGRDLKANEFSFELVHLHNGKETVVEVATNTVDGKVEFIRTYYAVNFPVGQLNVPVRYLIREVKGGLGGVTYSDDVYGVEITVHNDTATGKLYIDEDEIKYYKGTDFKTEIAKNDLVFTNKYEAKGTSCVPVGNKVLAGRDMDADEFSFSVKEFDPATGKIGDTVSTGLSSAAKNGEAASITFTPIGYPDRAGSNTTVYLNYAISEVSGNLGGVQYSDEVYYMTVAVSDDGEGTITAVATYYSGYNAETKTFTGKLDNPSDDVKFTNSYKPNSATVQLEATKKLSGRDLVDGEFDFVVTDSKGDPVTYGTNNADGQVIFGTISYDKEGKHEYKMSELVPSNADETGIIVGGEIFDVTVTVTDDGNGTLTATVSYSETPVFNNTYIPDEVEVELAAWKYLANKDLYKDEFTFVLEGGNDVKQTVTNDSDGLVSFESLVFDEVGTYYFTVSETGNTAMADGTYVNDETVYTVKIVVTDDQMGKLHATTTYYKNSVADENVVLSIDFFNSYNPDPITIDLSEQIGASKEMDSSVEYLLAGGEFEFVVTDVSGNVVSKGTNGASDSVTGIADITLDFFTFNTAGIYIYQIAESSTDKAGVTADLRQWSIHIQVRYDHENGVLYVNDEDVTVYSITREAQTSPEFVNKYDAEPIEVRIQANKTLIGRPLETGDFLFRLVDVSTGMVRDEVRNDINGEVNFNLTYNTPGTYNYEILEVDEGKYGIEYTTARGIAVVNVTDNDLDGKLEADCTVTNGNFENIYNPDNGTAQIVVEKLVTAPVGIDYNLSGGEFSFNLLKEGVVIDTVENDTNGYAYFDLSYDLDDLDGEESKTFSYVVEEVIPDEDEKLAGITYDAKTYQVQVTVTDNRQGKLETKVTVNDPNGVVLFENKYQPEPAENILTAQKSYNKKLDGGEFTFTLTGEGVEQVKTNQAGGLIEFDEITYYNVGTYEYKIVETVTDEKDYITYDTTEYTVQVVIADEMSGELFVKSVTVADDSDNSVEFINTYTPKDAGVTIEGTKNLVGGGLNAGDFTFALYMTGSDYSIEGLQPIATTFNAADGSFSFGSVTVEELNYSEEDTFYYVLVEEASDAIENLRYDNTAYKIKVEVTDNDSGSLVAEMQCINGDINALEFRNVPYDEIVNKDVFSYEEPSVSIHGEKVSAGEILNYVITYKNYTGEIVNLTVTDKIPEYTTYVNDSANLDGVYKDGMLTWNLEVAAKETVEMTFAVVVNGTDEIIINSAELDDGENIYTTNEVVNQIISPDMEIIKKQSVNGGEATVEKLEVNAGDEVTYYLTVTNNGKGDAYGISVADAIPFGLAYLQGSASHNGSEADSVVSWFIESLASGESVTLTFKVKVPEVTEETTWTNIASFVYENNPEGNEQPTESNEVEIVETPVPETGDKGNIWLWIALAFVSGGMFATLTVGERKRRTSK